MKGKWRRLILFFFIWSELIFLWSELILVQFYFTFIFLFDPSRSELIWPRLAVRVDPVRLLSLPIKTSGMGFLKLKTQTSITSDSILTFQNSIHLFFESNNQTYFCVALYGDFMTNLFHIETWSLEDLQRSRAVQMYTYACNKL